jgi:hypothetical protein
MPDEAVVDEAEPGEARLAELPIERQDLMGVAASAAVLLGPGGGDPALRRQRLLDVSGVDWSADRLPSTLVRQVVTAADRESPHAP